MKHYYMVNGTEFEIWRKNDDNSVEILFSHSAKTVGEAFENIEYVKHVFQGEFHYAKAFTDIQ